MKVIACGGMARSGKDTFVAIAKDILTKNGYRPSRFAFADELKREVSEMMLVNNFQVDIYSENTEIKTKNRPLLVWWGCTRREESDRGMYWVNRVHQTLTTVKENGNKAGEGNIVALISDVRFLNEVEWVKQSWNGYFSHIRRFKTLASNEKLFDPAPNEEEAKQDPLIRSDADYLLEWESRDILNGSSVLNDHYLRKKVLDALNSSCFFGNILGNLTDSK